MVRPNPLGQHQLGKRLYRYGLLQVWHYLQWHYLTEDGVIEVANSLYAGVLTPLRNNQTDVNDPTFTGSVVAANTQHELLASEMPIASQQSTFNALGNLWAVWKGDSNFANSTLGPVQAPAKYLSFKAAPPSAKALHAPTALRSVLVSGAEPAGAGKISLTVPQWLNSLWPIPMM